MEYMYFLQYLDRLSVKMKTKICKLCKRKIWQGFVIKKVKLKGVFRKQDRGGEAKLIF